MKLPKRDGLDGRYYLIHKPDTPAVVLELADQCIRDILEGTARKNSGVYPTVIRSSVGAPFLPNQLLERWLARYTAESFDYEATVAFCDAVRRLAGWNEVRHTLWKYVEQQVRKRYFDGEEQRWGLPVCTVKPEVRAEDVPEPLLHFACYVAVCHVVHGVNCGRVVTEYIFGLVSQIRPDMVKALKDKGTGKLPKDIQRFKTEHVTASANDAFATIRITVRHHVQEAYAEALDYLCRVCSLEEFPDSYSVEFKGPEKIYLSIPGLPKKGVNQLFACAALYPELHPLMERYACLAMKEFEMYTNLGDELCVLPGTFAVFALGMVGPEWWPLVCDYLDRCDDEHSSLQEKFVQAMIGKYGFTAQSLPVFVRGVLSMQWMKSAKNYPALMAHAESLDALLEVKEHLGAYLLAGESSDARTRTHIWQEVLRVIWGKTAENGGIGIIRKAPKELRERYEKIFHT